jgi:hypothetical protein
MSSGLSGGLMTSAVDGRENPLTRRRTRVPERRSVL